MTENQSEPNPFAQFFDPAQLAMIGPIIVDDEDDGTVFTEAIGDEFQEVMESLSGQVPDDDEAVANTMMSDAVQNLMIRCFRAGMLFQEAITPDQPGAQDDDEAVELAIDPGPATQLVLGLMAGNGAVLRLVVNRGQD